MAELDEVFEMTTKQMEPDQDSWNQQERRQRKTALNRKVGALVIAAVIGLAAVVLIFELRPGEHARTPVTQSSAGNPTGAAAVDVATGFLDAYGAFDAERARGYLAESADITGMTEGRGIEGLALALSFSKAEGYRQTITSCEASTRASETTILCEYDFHAIRSDEIGLGPYSGSYFRFTVRDGKIVRASNQIDASKFSPQMWEPFAAWVSTTYPEDAAVMFNKQLTNFRLTEESIRLWDQRTREYVKVVNGAGGQ